MRSIILVCLYATCVCMCAQEMTIDKKEFAIGVLGGMHWGTNDFNAFRPNYTGPNDNIKTGLRPHAAISFEYVLRGYGQRYTNVKLGITSIHVTFDWIFRQTGWSRSYGADGSFRQNNLWNTQHSYSVFVIKKQSNLKQLFGLGLGTTFSVQRGASNLTNENGEIVIDEPVIPGRTYFIGIVPLAMHEVNFNSKWSTVVSFSWPIEVMCDCSLGTANYTWIGHKIGYLRWCSNNWPLLKAGVSYHISRNERGYR